MNNRNQPCACGSGSKTKRCCQSPEAQAKRAAEAKAARLEAYRARQEQLRKEREERSCKDPEHGPFTYRRGPRLPMLFATAAAMAMQPIPGGRR
jgi:hypothetical protein